MLYFRRSAGTTHFLEGNKVFFQQKSKAIFPLFGTAKKFKNGFRSKKLQNPQKILTRQIFRQNLVGKHGRVLPSNIYVQNSSELLT